MANPAPISLAIFASGGGSNARKLLEHFSGSDLARVTLLCTDNPRSGLFGIGEDHDLPVHLLSVEEYGDGTALVSLMERKNIGLLVLAGYLKLIPQGLLSHLPGRIINIHPALLPDYGGKGMYGMNVHNSVIASGERYSGITIHSIDEEYDRGKIIFQSAIELDTDWDGKQLQKAVQKLEHQYFPKVVEKLCLRLREKEK